MNYVTTTEELQSVQCCWEIAARSVLLSHLCIHKTIAKIPSLKTFYEHSLNGMKFHLCILWFHIEVNFGERYMRCMRPPASLHVLVPLKETVIELHPSHSVYSAQYKLCFYMGNRMPNACVFRHEPGGKIEITLWYYQNKFVSCDVTPCCFGGLSVSSSTLFWLITLNYIHIVSSQTWQHVHDSFPQG